MIMNNSYNRQSRLDSAIAVLRDGLPSYSSFQFRHERAQFPNPLPRQSREHGLPVLRREAVGGTGWVQAGAGDRADRHATIPADKHGRACTSTLVRMVMTLRDDGTWLEHVDARVTCPGQPTRPAPMKPADPSPYTLRGPRGDTLDLYPQGSADLSLQGALDGDELRLVMIYNPRADTTRFRYVRQPRPD